MISLYFANPGAGKTTYLAKIAQKYNKPTSFRRVIHKITMGKSKLESKYDKVYCNVPIYNTFKFDVDQDLGIKHIEKSLLLIDEGAIVLDNRTPLSDEQKTFLRLHRHYKVDIVCVSQSWEDINIVVRRLYDRIYLMNKTHIGHLTIFRKIKKLIQMSEEGQIQDMYKFTHPLFGGFQIFNRKPYYRFFNSYDRPQLSTTPDIIYEGKLPDTKLRKVINLAKHRKIKDKNHEFKEFKNIDKELKNFSSDSHNKNPNTKSKDTEPLKKFTFK
jgi:hypothetical protein